jgi:hypothetical protein
VARGHHSLILRLALEPVASIRVRQALDVYRSLFLYAFLFDGGGVNAYTLHNTGYTLKKYHTYREADETVYSSTLYPYHPANRNGA